MSKISFYDVKKKGKKSKTLCWTRRGIWKHSVPFKRRFIFIWYFSGRKRCIFKATSSRRLFLVFLLSPLSSFFTFIYLFIDLSNAFLSKEKESQCFPNPWPAWCLPFVWLLASPGGGSLTRQQPEKEASTRHFLKPIFIRKTIDKKRR